MKKYLFILVILGLSLLESCNQRSKMDDDAIWKLGWRMIGSSMEGHPEIAEFQFDSLLTVSKEMELKFLLTGLEVKSQLRKDEEVLEILSGQSQEMLWQVCQRPFTSSYQPCLTIALEQVENETLQMELIKMFVDDQAVRGNWQSEMIDNYQIDTAQITNESGPTVDANNRNRLKEIFHEFGFPTRQLVGREAMRGIFMIIQHADADTAWQRSQLENIKTAVTNGDMDGQNYAYLYDRIKINGGEKQRYGTQFSKVDPINKVVELADTEDLINLDNRRREIGMMPINMYKKFMLKNL